MPRLIKKITEEELRERLNEFFEKFSCKKCGKELKLIKSDYCVDCRAELNHQKIKSYLVKKWLKK